nr:MAG TPA: Protein of unknown function (DUF2800) [Caudoviricetes sp.]
MNSITILPQLNNSNVIYIEDTHEYFTNEFKKLHGITGFINDQLFPGKLDGIPESVLSLATERGKRVHEECENIDNEGIEAESKQGENYLRLKSDFGLTHIASEYIVTDNEFIASPIDKVYLGRYSDSVILGDIKTTYKLDMLYLSWQLSIYAYFFERQNSHLRVDALLAIWLRGEDTDSIVQVERIPDKEIEIFLQCCKEGLKYVDNCSADSYVAKLNDLPSKVSNVEESVYQLIEMKKTLDEQMNKFKSQLLELMKEAKADNIKGDLITITRKKAYQRELFDAKAMKDKYPDVYDEFVKLSDVKESIQIKAK